MIKKIDKKKILWFVISSFLFVNIAFGQNIQGVVNNVIEIVLKIGKFLVVVAFMFFIWNIASFILSLSGKDHEKYRSRVMWSVVAIFVLLSVWGIVKIMQNTTKMDNNQKVDLTSDLKNFSL